MKKLIICLVICFGVNAVCFAWDDVKTHRLITERAVFSIKTSFGNTLKNNLDINNGLTQLYKNTIDGSDKTYSVLNWVKEGSYAEDNPWCKASSHFHDPLKAWPDAGLNGFQGPLASGIDAFCALTSRYTTKYSNLVWATGYADSDEEQGRMVTINNMDWDAARRFYKEFARCS